jgi:Methyltransferase domain/Domain of unknown function DUF120
MQASSSYQEFTGHVVSGRGFASQHLSTLADEIAPIVGGPPYPGSLNVVLDRPLRLEASEARAVEGGARLFWPATLNGLPVWLYRWTTAPLHVVEIVSPQYLRGHLGLHDNDRVAIAIGREQVAGIKPFSRAVWASVWLGRRDWAYTNPRYVDRTRYWCSRWGANQAPTDKGFIDMVSAIVKAAVKRTPVIGPLARRLFGRKTPPPYQSRRMPLESASPPQRPLIQVRNLLDYTKTSNASYAGKVYPAGYHTIDILGVRLQGQRDPTSRLAMAPIDFSGKTVLDLGCNQGGMLHPIGDKVRWAVGVDYDPRMINVANKIKCVNGADTLSFFVLDLERESLDIIRDFLPDLQVDIVFLLSVCMWIKNWRDVIDFAQGISGSMLFETNGTPQQQKDQLDYLERKYRSVLVLSESSTDDPNRRNRALYFLSDPVR